VEVGRTVSAVDAATPGRADRLAQSPWRDELSAFARAFSGAALFGMPLLFTMEMWWIGSYAERWKLLLFLALALVANCGLSYFAGFHRGRGLGLAVHEAIDAVAVGVVGSVVVLLVLDRIDPGDPLDAVLGKVVIQSVPLSLGASVANAVFGRRGERSRTLAGEEEPAPPSGRRIFLNDVAATLIGSVFLGFNIAPTDEVAMLAAELDALHQLALIGFSLLLGYVIVFESEFDTTQAEVAHWVPFQRPSTETVLAYLLSLLVALTLLVLFDRIHRGDPLGSVLAQTLVLGLPTTVGGAAGRLVI
jgi:putative integral membrane protein (TIGR02587 family)